MKFLIYVFLLVLTATAQAQFKCLDSGASCSNQNDQSCRFVKDVWNSIKDKEDSWAKTLKEHSSESKNHVRYSSTKNYCKHQGYQGSTAAQISINIKTQSSTEQKYQISHTACGTDEIFQETWEIHGTDLKKINIENLIYYLQRKFDLTEGENYKRVTFRGNPALFVPYKAHPLPFSPFHSDIILQHTTFKEVSKKEPLQTEIKSYLNIFDQNLLYQNINITNETTEMYFYSPTYPFYNERYRSFFAQRDNVESLCYKTYLNINDDKFLTMKTGLTKNRYGLEKPELQSKCLQQEVTFYKDEMLKILGTYADTYFPKFSSDLVQKDSALLRELRIVIRQIESGDTTNSLLTLKNRILPAVISGKIKDER